MMVLYTKSDQYFHLIYIYNEEISSQRKIEGERKNLNKSFTDLQMLQ